MKKLLLTALLAIGTYAAYCQTDIYDGDWYHSYNGIGVNESGERCRGAGKDVYRIRTENGSTTVRVKVQYPCKTEYEYWECDITKCDEYSLEWNSEINRYKDVDNPQKTFVVKYYCKLRKINNTLKADIYCLQTTIIGGIIINSTKYGEDTFTLYKDGNDW